MNNMLTILIVTYDLAPGRMRLMPWRTIIEVANNMRNLGHEVTILSINKGRPSHTSGDEKSYKFPIVFTNKIDESISCLRHYYNGNPPRFDVIYFPITWRSAFKDFKAWPLFKCPVVAYHGAAHYRFIDVLKSARYMPLKSLIPFFLDALTPPRLLIKALTKRKIRGVICMSEFNRRLLISSGWPENHIVAIPPGIEKYKASPKLTTPDLVSLTSNDKYFLFLGNALPIRGIGALIDAAKIVFSKHDTVKVICLIRSDPGNEMELDSEKLRRKLSDQEISPRMLFLKKNVSIDEIRLSIQNSIAVVLPFLLVPSEIPLGILEAMNEGSLVITTLTGGTSEFVGKNGYLAQPANPKSLAEQMLLSISNTEENKKKRILAKKQLQVHPNWDGVAQSWLNFAEYCLQERN